MVLTNNKNICSLILSCLLFCSCAKVQVSQDYDVTYPFGNEKSYGWNNILQQTESGLLTNNELLAKRFFKAIKQNMQDKGFSSSETQAPDILVSCSYNVTSKIVSDPVSTGFGFGFGRHSRYGGFGISSGSYVRQYDQGKLTISFHSTSSGELIWRGTGTREVFTHSDPATLTKNVQEMVQAVLKQFPPAP